MQVGRISGYSFTNIFTGYVPTCTRSHSYLCSLVLASRQIAFVLASIHVYWQSLAYTLTSTHTCWQSLKFGLISTNLPSPAFMFILLYLMLTRRYVHSHPLSRTDAWSLASEISVEWVRVGCTREYADLWQFRNVKPDNLCGKCHHLNENHRQISHKLSVASGARNGRAV